MLFTTATFICLFLPVVLAGFFAIARFSHGAAALWLFLASVVFYGYWMPEFTLLLLGSIIGNFWVGTRISASTDSADAGQHARSKHWLMFGVAVNLALLSYFKYANFFIDNLNAMLGSGWDIGRVILPIGISFFTFTQIAYLVDTWRKGVREHKFVHYGLFVTYFPHLIAGPVLHHAQMMPQFGQSETYRFQAANFTAGLAIFALGMFKKVVLADGVSPYADAIFAAADAGTTPSFAEAWLGAIAYTVQLYFDFSGYSDMAIGLSWMVNIRLPFNFNAPYQATNISDFWRRWHMSLSQFLRDYLYIALGGNRKGAIRRYVNLMATMVLGGLWHGASWSFVLWGFLHGLFLGVNHAFRALCGPRWCERLAHQRAFVALSWLLTMLSVTVAWVVFRAETLAGALGMLASMVKPAMFDPAHTLLWNAGLDGSRGWSWCAALCALAIIGPNSNHIGSRLRTLCQHRATARHLLAGLSFTAVGFILTINLMRDSVSAFIYFNF
ncbi:MBOAT family O-acyltransferase [Rhodoferax sp.]|uniref:MBOAT family O-acyltransferase n=1 Tax=Rhodoferax sp. TaxID=50421 RepID=UPI00275AA1DC|nr:MBOAT family O-acyltransferase [Rhodoferax sp.]